VTSWRAAILAVGCLVAAGHQDDGLRYAAANLDCSRWAESSRSQIETIAGGRSGKASAGRDAILRVRAVDTTGGVSLEGWFDSLSVWRRTGNDELVPDTDGLIGGRYRGLLGARGRYTSLVQPFVPDEVAEVAEMAGALDDLFPALPPRPLAPGTSWGDSVLLVLRLPDTLVSGRALRRFALTLRHERREILLHGDSVPVPVRQTITDKGEFTWDPKAGLEHRARTVLVETSIPPNRRIRQAVRSRVEQRVELKRLSAGSCE